MKSKRLITVYIIHLMRTVRKHYTSIYLWIVKKPYNITSLALLSIDDTLNTWQERNKEATKRRRNQKKENELMFSD